MTNREFYTAVMAIENAPADIVEFAQAAITKMDETNAKRKAKVAEGNTKKAEKNAPIKAAILAALTNEAQSASALGAIVGVSHNRVTPLAKQLVAEGLAEVTDIKVPGKGPCKGYSLAVAD